MINAKAELSAIALVTGHKGCASYIGNPIKWAESVRSYPGTADVPNAGTRIRIWPCSKNVVAKLRRFDNDGLCSSSRLSQALIAEEKERPVLHDWASKRAAEKVPTEHRRSCLESVSGSQLIVLVVVVCCSVKLIRPRFGDHLDLRARISPVH